MKYKKFSNVSGFVPKTSAVSINSLDEIPLPNEIEIDHDNENTSEDIVLPQEDSTSNEVNLSNNAPSNDKKRSNILDILFKNTNLDDVLLFAILVLLLQEDSPDELLIGLILILFFNR